MSAGQERAGLIIRNAIMRSGIKASEVAAKAGMQRANISKLSKGSYDPKFSTLLRIIEACGFEFIEMRVRKVAISDDKKQIVVKAKLKP